MPGKIGELFYDKARPWYDEDSKLRQLKVKGLLMGGHDGTNRHARRHAGYLCPGTALKFNLRKIYCEKQRHSRHLRAKCKSSPACSTPWASPANISASSACAVIHVEVCRRIPLVGREAGNEVRHW